MECFQILVREKSMEGRSPYRPGWRTGRRPGWRTGGRPRPVRRPALPLATRRRNPRLQTLPSPDASQLFQLGASAFRARRALARISRAAVNAEKDLAQGVVSVARRVRNIRASGLPCLLLRAKRGVLILPESGQGLKVVIPHPGQSVPSGVKPAGIEGGGGVRSSRSRPSPGFWPGRCAGRSAGWG